MEDIELTELPESKEFMKHVKIADGLTLETGLEHGFKFCKPNDEIIVDKMCVGNKCEILVTGEKCNEISNGFHSHPGISLIGTRFSVGDVYEVSRKAYYAKESMISCVKAVDDNNIICKKVVPPSYDDLWYMNGLRLAELRNRDVMDKEDFIKSQTTNINKMDKMTNASNIRFKDSQI